MRQTFNPMAPNLPGAEHHLPSSLSGAVGDTGDSTASTDLSGDGATASHLQAGLSRRASLYIRLLALGGALGPILFTVVVGVCSALRPGYNHLTQLISELGATGTSHAAFMNFAGFLPAGLSIAGFGLASVWLIPRSGRSILAGAMISIFGLGIAVAGIFHCDPGCPQHGASLASTIHDRISVIAFLTCIAGIGLWALHFRRIATFRSLWKYSAASSVVGLVFLYMVASSLESRHLTGLWQRLMLGTLFVWCMVLARRSFRLRPRFQPANSLRTRSG